MVRHIRILLEDDLKKAEKKAKAEKFDKQDLQVMEWKLKKIREKNEARRD